MEQRRVKARDSRRVVQTDCTAVLQPPCGPRAAGAVSPWHVWGEGGLDGNQERAQRKPKEMPQLWQSSPGLSSVRSLLTDGASKDSKKQRMRHKRPFAKDTPHPRTGAPAGLGHPLRASSGTSLLVEP